MGNNSKFILPDHYDVLKMSGELPAHYSIKKERIIAENYAFFDTFDWRLFDKSLVLYESGNTLFLRKLYESVIIKSDEMVSPPVFIGDFPDGELKDLLAPIIKMRALLKLVEVYSRSTPYRILNQNEKTIARLAYEEIRSSRNKNEPALATYLWLKPVRGYIKNFRELAERLEKTGSLINKKEEIFFKALEAVDKKPGSYSAKLNIQLDPDMSADEATKIILRFLLQVMRINEAYIEKDLDTEFLHDFRVAIRRTRSALSQIKNVIPAQTTDRFKKDFAFVCKLTNQLRDLDVYLLNEDTYKAMLPDVLRDDIDPLFDYLRKKRSKVFQEVSIGLESKEYKQILGDWSTFLNEPPQDSPTAFNDRLPIHDIARKRIYKRYRNSVKTGIQILENTEDEMLHTLRIECKKLRYFMEFFSSLFPRRKVNILIDQLKKLQDNLGEFNDLCVQEEYLLNIAEELTIAVHQSKKTLLAIGSLIGTLDREKQIVKNGFAKTFTDFVSPENKKLFQELFGSK